MFTAVDQCHYHYMPLPIQQWHKRAQLKYFRCITASAANSIPLHQGVLYIYQNTSTITWLCERQARWCDPNRKLLMRDSINYYVQFLQIQSPLRWVTHELLLFQIVCTYIWLANIWHNACYYFGYTLLVLLCCITLDIMLQNSF